MTPTRPRTVACAMLLAAALTGCTASVGAPDASGGTVLTVSPAGTGACTAEAPCGFEDALDRAASGTRIELGPGDYGDLRIDGYRRFAEFADPLVIAAAPHAEPVVGGLRISSPGVHLEDLTVAGLLSFDAGADGGRAERVHVTGSGMFVRADHVQVIDSLFEGGSSVDGIQIARASDVLVEGTTVRDYDQEIDNGRHADCIQLFDVADVVIRGNHLSNCYNAGLIISGGGRGIQGLLVEANFIQGCVERTERCGGGSAAELREQGVSDLVVRNNTFLNGSVRWGSAPGAVFDRNVVSYLSECGSRISNSVVLKWNVKMCKVPEWLDADGNRTGDYQPLDPTTGDLAPVEPTQARISPAGDLEPAPAGIDGAALPDDVAGAIAVG